MLRAAPIVTAFVFLASCSDTPQTMARDNLLVLEIGGDNRSLRASLARPPREPRSVTEPPAPTIRHIPPEPNTVPPTTPPAPRFRVISLPAGETLYGLCRQHLGDGGRWKEIAALNGWSEDQAANLAAGQKVKLPIQ